MVIVLMKNKNASASSVAFGGMMAALTVAWMALGGIVPVNTFVCPALSVLILDIVQRRCGKRIGLAWYFVVALLSCLMCPDPVASAVFTALGYYPLVRDWLTGRKLAILWKTLLFNGSVMALYLVLGYVLGLEDALEELYTGWMLGTTLLMGNIVFFLMDLLLDGRFARKWGRVR